VVADEDAIVKFLVGNDVSVRIFSLDQNDSGPFLIVANSLSDLARRENRFARTPIPFRADFRADAFPYPVDTDLLLSTKMVNQNGLSGNETLMTDVAAFDVQIYSPDSLVALVDTDNDGVNETAVTPSDVGYSEAVSLASTVTEANGGFVDLAVPNGGARFTNAPLAQSQLTDPLFRTYCTWSPHYEADGLDQDDGSSGPIDEGTNGIDDDGINGVDDEGERETFPPYIYPARGLKVTFRIIEKKSKQVRQATVVQNFLPQ